MTDLLRALGFVGTHLGWFLAAALVVAAVGGLTAFSTRARDSGISHRLLVTAAVIGVGSLVLAGLPMVVLGLFARPTG